MKDGYDPVEQRYGGLGPDRTVAFGEVIEIMLRHRSVRNYADRSLPDGLLETLIAAGQSGPTSSNMQAVSVVAVTDPARRQALSELANNQKFLAEAPVVLCFVADLSRAGRVGEAIGADLFALPMLDTFMAAFGDCAIFAQNVSVAAQSMGLGSCFVGNLRSDPLRMAEMLELPPGAFVAFGLTLGYETGELTGIRPRLPQTVVLHRERYDHGAEAAEIAQYDEVFAGHEATQSRPRVTWSQRHQDRYASRTYLNGRERMREILGQLGLPLL